MKKYKYSKYRFNKAKGIFLLPNLLTTIALFLGFFSILNATAQKYELAAILILFATLFDFLDGKIARLTHSQSDFGVEYDSLSDLTAFCLSPAVLMYLFCLHHFGRLGMAVSFLYFACGALRLARYNVQVTNTDSLDYQGLPTTLAGGLVSSAVVFLHQMEWVPTTKSWILLLGLITLSLLMVSNLRYRSLKRVQRTSFMFVVVVVSVIVFGLVEPKINIFLMMATYILSGPCEWFLRTPDKSRVPQEIYRELVTDLKGEEHQPATSTEKSDKVVSIRSNER